MIPGHTSAVARLVAVLGLVLLPLLTLLAWSTPTSAATVTPVIASAPAPGASGLAPDGSYFAPTIAPGAKYRAAVVVANSRPTPVTVRLYPVDGRTAPGSGSAYSAAGAALQRAGSWISVSEPSLTLAPRSQETVRFSVAVPRGAAPGNHLAGIAIERAHPPVTTKAAAAARSVIGVLVTVPGPAKFSVAVGAPQIRLAAHRVGTVVIALSDTGALLGKPILVVSLTNESGYSRTITRSLDTVLPGDATQIKIPWPARLSGTYQIKICAQGGGLATPTCTSGSATPRAATAAAQNPVGFPLHLTSSGASSRSAGHTPLLVLAALLGAIALLGASLVLGTRIARKAVA